MSTVNSNLLGDGIAASVVVRRAGKSQSVLSSWRHNGLRLAPPVFYWRLLCHSLPLPVSGRVSAACSLPIGAFRVTMLQVLQGSADLVSGGCRRRWNFVRVSPCREFCVHFVGGGVGGVACGCGGRADGL